MRQNIVILSLIISALCIQGCSVTGNVPATDIAGTNALNELSTPTTVGEIASPSVASSLAPREVEFTSSDGIIISGTFYPPVKTPAPAVVLMHMMGGSRLDWSEFAALLQGAGLSQPSTRRSYAVLTIDMRGHGISGGKSSDRAKMVDDASMALTFVRSLPGVNPDSIFLAGASIGADAAVDACGDGCIGAISLSPGGFLGVDYGEALIRLDGKPVLCIASSADTLSAQTCRGSEQSGLGDYQVQLYSGGAHGTQLLAITDQQPAVIDLLFDWLRSHTPQ